MMKKHKPPRLEKLDLPPPGVDLPPIAVDLPPIAVEPDKPDAVDVAELQRQSLAEFMRKKNSIVTTDLKDEDFERLCELGSGNGGVVMKVLHRPSGVVMARKLIHLEVKAEIQKQIASELLVLHKCQSPYIVGYFGAFLAESEINVCMEHMDGGSLDLIVKRCGRIPAEILLKITYSIVEGLKYLRETLRIIHRDIKPSNILVNSRGEIKMCDFGVSGQLTQVDSMAVTFVGTRSYMAPERLQGMTYTIQSDIWSLGLSLIEMALAIFPIPPPTMEQMDRAMAQSPAGSCLVNSPLPDDSDAPPSMAIFELLECIVNDPPPKLSTRHFEKDACDFVEICLKKEPKDRATLNMLLEHEYVHRAERTEVNVSQWVKSTMETPF